MSILEVKTNVPLFEFPFCLKIRAKLVSFKTNGRPCTVYLLRNSLVTSGSTLRAPM
jgi:hypothetical protein